MLCRSNRFLFLAVVFLLKWISVVDAYASWLKCYVDLDETEVIMNHQVKTVENAPHLVNIMVKENEESEWAHYWNYTPGVSKSLQVRLDVPEALQEEDVQYVIETSNGAKFTTSVMCEGKRSFARAYDEAVTLEVDGSTDTVSLRAGWAIGHAPVSLTPFFVMWAIQDSTSQEL